MKKPVLILFSIVFVDMLGFGLILPLLPYYARTFGASSFIIGLLLSSYALGQLFGAPVVGRLSDRFGRKPMLLLSVGGTFVCLVLLGAAQTMTLLFISRFFDGLTGGNITVAQAYIADKTDEKDRAKGLGLIGAAFGLGFIIGPTVGGLLSQWGYSVPAFTAAGLAFINLILIITILPESLTPEKKAELAHSRKTAFSINLLFQALKKPKVGPLLQTAFIFGLSFAVFQSVFSMFNEVHLNFSARTTGLTLAYVGVLIALVQGVLIGKLAKKFREERLVFFSSVVLFFSVLAWSFTSGIAYLLIVLIPIAVSTGILTTVLRSLLTKSVATEEIGGTLGLSTAIESLSRVLAPAIGGFLLGTWGAWTPGVFSAVLTAAVIVIIALGFPAALKRKI